MEAKCRNKNCQNKKDIDKMFYYKIPIRDFNDKVIYGAFNGIYFCNSICWLVFKGIIDDVKIIKELKCKAEPTCDECFSKVGIAPCIIYNHKPFCQEVFAIQLKNIPDHPTKQCKKCEVIEKLINCEDLKTTKELIKEKKLLKDKETNQEESLKENE